MGYTFMQKTLSKEDVLSLAMLLLTTKSLMQKGRQLGRALNSHFPHCAPFDMQSSVTQTALRQL